MESLCLTRGMRSSNPAPTPPPHFLDLGGNNTILVIKSKSPNWSHTPRAELNSVAVSGTRGTGTGGEREGCLSFFLRKTMTMNR